MNTPLDLLCHDILWILQECRGIDVAFDLKNVAIITSYNLKNGISFGFGQQPDIQETLTIFVVVKLMAIVICVVMTSRRNTGFLLFSRSYAAARLFHVFIQLSVYCL